MSATSYDYRKYAVMYVDDEEQALKYFRKAMDKEFRVLTATSVAEACAILDREAATIGDVLTDQRMPGQLGVELLKRIRAQWPGIVRLLITAYSDIDSAIESVNSGAISKYITKPADLKELKLSLKSAMESFLDTCQRETLLKERLEVMQRMVVADRVKSLATMAGGISHHLRNSMTALTCFLEEAAASGTGGTKGSDPISSDPAFVEQLWALAHRERERLMHLVESVGRSVAEPDYVLTDEVVVLELLQKGRDAVISRLAGRNVELNAATDLPCLKGDERALTQLVQILLAYAARLSQTDGAISLVASRSPVGGGITIMIKGAGPNWTEGDVAACFTPFAFPEKDPSDLGLDLMTAFSIAYHHGGDLVVHASAPTGPAFELRLPENPATVRRPDLQEGLMQKLVTGLPGSANADKAA